MSSAHNLVTEELITKINLEYVTLECNAFYLIWT